MDPDALDLAAAVEPDTHTKMSDDEKAIHLGFMREAIAMVSEDLIFLTAVKSIPKSSTV